MICNTNHNYLGLCNLTLIWSFKSVSVCLLSKATMFETFCFFCFHAWRVPLVICVLLRRVSLSTVTVSTCSSQLLWTPSTFMWGRETLSPGRWASPCALRKLPTCSSFCWALHFLCDFWLSGVQNVEDELLAKCLRMTENTQYMITTLRTNI